MFIKRLLMCALLAVCVPLVAMAQQTVFNDTFVNGSTVGQTSTPGGTPTASSTSYDIATPKSVATLAGMGCVIANGQFNLAMIGTSSAYIESSAVFTTHPVTLAIPGDTIDIQNVFTATTNYFSVSGFGGSATLALGLFNSGGSAPDTNMFNNGLVSSTTTEAIGHAQNWLGYRCNLAYGAGTATANSATMSRPAQNQGNNLNQSVINGFTGNVNLGQNSQNITPLTIGSQYTEDFKITLQPNGSLAMTNTLYAGVGTGGTVLATNNAAASGANILTTNFDALCIGGNRTGNTANPTTNFINQIIVTFASINQAGPYFSVNSSGNPCTGGVDVTLNGSVTTNTYLLYTNGIFNGQALAGTGAALDFGIQTIPATYTVIASNTVTANMGPMYGSANVFAPGVTIGTQPTSVTVVSNLPTSFSVAAVGAALSYQWYKNGVPLTNNANISGAQTATLNIAAVGPGNAATSLNGYTVIAQTPCGTYATSAPPVSLSVTQPRNLIWAGNVFSAWDYTTDQEFTFGGSPTSFTAGDNASFDDSSAYTTVTISNDVTSTLVSVVGTQSYTFTGANKLTGVSALAIGGTATLTIANNGNNFTGGTTVSNGATLSIGNGSGVNGNLTGTVMIAPTGTLNYSSGASSVTATINMLNGFSGSGTININDAAGATYATAASLVVNSNFNGIVNIQGYTAVHASSGNAGYALGNGSTINVSDNAQVWLDPSATAYNNTFNIGGNGWLGATPQTGAMRVYNNTINGNINLMDNARIGGTINGSTLQGVLSGAYQLEVWGTTNSFVLVMGPTNGSPQAYASTLITAGSIQAANSNAISTGPLTLDSGGDLRLFGSNLTVSNLSSVNSGHVLSIEGPRVRNMNTTNAATLTVGSDGTSNEFDGIFSDGAAASFGLTKVGAGTLTLTAVNTNTGAVTVNAGTLAMSGSGLFGKASQIIANNGGVYDVTGAGGTLTLNSGQTLRGNNGTVNGIFVASAGSTVAPGFPLGTLTVSGNAAVNGIYRPNLNRTNAPSNCSQFASGGSITFSGATLSVSNVGPGLHLGDAFQLFGGATAGFTSFSPQTNDAVNNLTYTWNNTVASDGKMTVAGVLSRVPILQTAPTVSAIVYGRAISNSIVSVGSVTNAAGAAVAGTFAFVTPGTVPYVGVTNQSVTFTPTDSNGYNSITFIVGVTVNQQTPVLKTAPTASTITNGNTLSISILTGGVVTNAFNTNMVAGSFAFTTPSATPGVGTANQSVTFTPTDTADYNSITLNVSVTVVAAPSAVTALKFTGNPVVSGTNLTISVTNTGAGTFFLLNSTNAASAKNTWTPLWTNVAAGSSSFTATVTNAVTPVLGHQFYILSTTNY